METLVGPLIASLRNTVPMLVRTSPTSEEYLEGILSRDDLQRCCTLLTDALGASVKAFDQAVRFEPSMQKVVAGLGGIRLEQCLFLKSVGAQRAIYAALWPWASDALRITLKVGVVNVGPS